VLRVKLTHDHLSALGGITPDGRLLMQIQEHAYTALEVVRFRHLVLRRISGNLLVIWDGSSIHRAQVIKGFLKRKAAKRLRLERLPGYALNLTHKRASGLCSNAGNSRMSVAGMCPKWPTSSVMPKNGCDTGEPS